MDDWALLLLSALASTVLWRRIRPSPSPADPRMDAAIAVLIGLASFAVLLATHEAANEDWTPYGQDNHDYYACIVALRWNLPELWSPARYPLYPALTVASSLVSGVSLWITSMGLSLITSASLPASVYLLGRTVAARPVAIAGALLTLHLPTHLTMLATPTDYPLAATLFVLSTAAIVAATRRPTVGRYALAGTLLAAYLLATPKSLPLILLGATGLGLGLVDQGRRAVLHALALLAPLVAAWAVFAALPLRLFTLEEDIVAVQLAGSWLDPGLPFPNVGWTLGGPGERGYWIPGHAKALWHLPDVVKYLLEAPVHAMTLAERFDAFVPRMAGELSMTACPALVVIAVLGCLCAGMGEGKAARRMLTAGLALAIVGGTLWGLTSAPPAERYQLPSLVTAPVLLLALACFPAREANGVRGMLAFLPLLAAVGWVSGPSTGSLGSNAFQQQIQILQARAEPIAALKNLRERLTPGDAVIDGTDTRLMAALLDGEGAVITWAPVREGARALSFRYPAGPQKRRFVVFSCVNQGDLAPESAYEHLRRSVAEDTGRFMEIGRCIFEDLRPDLPYSTSAERPAPGG